MDQCSSFHLSPPTLGGQFPGYLYTLYHIQNSKSILQYAVPEPRAIDTEDSASVAPGLLEWWSVDHSYILSGDEVMCGDGEVSKLTYIAFTCIHIYLLHLLL